MAYRSKLAKLAGGAAFALTAVVSINANAATLSIVGGGAASLSATNFDPTTTAATAAQMVLDGVVPGLGIKFFDSTATNLTGLFASPNPVNLTFQFMGFEANFHNAASNSLTFSGATIFTNVVGDLGLTTPLLTYAIGTDPGLVPISFKAAETGTATNGAGTTAGLRIAFYQVSPDVAYAFFDDGGAGPDRDYDDMIVRIVATNPEVGDVPLPGAVFLFGSVLAAGVGGFHLRRRRAVKA